MAEIIYAIWRMKAEFLPAGIVSSTMYTAYGREPVDKKRWEFLGKASDPSKHVARDVRAKGYSLRQVSAGNSARMEG
jgi:hypothetical protein